MDKGDGEEIDQGHIFNLFIIESLKSIGIECTDPGEELDLPTFSKILMVVMEINNLQELFQSFEGFNRNTPIK